MKPIVLALLLATACSTYSRRVTYVQNHTPQQVESEGRCRDVQVPPGSTQFACSEREESHTGKVVLVVALVALLVVASSFDPGQHQPNQ